MRLQPGGRGQGGFTLLEVLLAFVVFALSFATVLEILSGSMRSTVRARDYSEAALTAQSLMDMVGTEVPLAEGSYGGEAAGGFDWSMEITAYQSHDGDDYLLTIAEMNGTLLYWVDLRLAWGDGVRAREATFTTVRGQLAGAQP